MIREEVETIEKEIKIRTCPCCKSNNISWDVTGDRYAEYNSRLPFSEYTNKRGIVFFYCEEPGCGVMFRRGPGISTVKEED